MKSLVKIDVTYSGAHNFDWDSQLEQIAKKVRYWATMDFEKELRTISFQFEDDSEVEIQKSELFVAAVRNTFPEFTVGVAP